MYQESEVNQTKLIYLSAYLEFPLPWVSRHLVLGSEKRDMTLVSQRGPSPATQCCEFLIY